MACFVSKKSRGGFTLIELLVVVSIISLLASVVLASLNTARAKARDIQRMSDLRTMQKVVELYRNDNGAYPSTGAAWWGEATTCGAGWSNKTRSGASGFIPNVTPTYISLLPADPKPSASGGCYLYRSDGTDYMILAWTSVEGSVPVTIGFRRPGYPNEASFAVYTTGGAGW